MTGTEERLTIEEYHADYTRDSNSSLRLFEESRERYAAIRVFGAMQPEPPTPAMVLGNALDCLLLDGAGEFSRRYTLAPECDRRTKIGKALWAEYLKELDGRTPLTADQFATVNAMREGVLRNQWARHWLEADGDCQRTFLWDDPRTGLPLKCRPDKILRNGLIGDLKTTGRSLRKDAWARTILNYGYHMQAALYLTGTDVAGIGDAAWVWVVVSSDPPHECAVYTMGARTRRLGQQANETTLQALAECKSSGDWSGEFSRDLHEVDVPDWELRKALI